MALFTPLLTVCSDYTKEKLLSPQVEREISGDDKKINEIVYRFYGVREEGKNNSKLKIQKLSIES